MEPQNFGVTSSADVYEARIRRLKVALVTAAIPVEALLMSGSDRHMCREMRDGFRDAALAIRAAILEDS